MRNKEVFKSEEGKRKIIAYYDNIIKGLPVQYKERYIDTVYGRTYVIETGQDNKPSLFLFHGSSSNNAMWFGDLERLSEKYHVFAVDILGEPGKSDANRLDIKTDEYTDWINKLLISLNIDRAMFMGNSLGGWIILNFAAQYSEKAEKLVLIAPSGVTNTRLSFVIKSLFYAVQGEKGMKKLSELVYGDDDIPEEVLEFTNLVMKNFNPIIGGLPKLTDNQLAELKMPVLLIAGKDDCITDSSKAVKRLQSILPDLSIDIIKDNGHVIYNVTDKVNTFLDK